MNHGEITRLCFGTEVGFRKAMTSPPSTIAKSLFVAVLVIPLTAEAAPFIHGPTRFVMTIDQQGQATAGRGTGRIAGHIDAHLTEDGSELVLTTIPKREATITVSVGGSGVGPAASTTLRLPVVSHSESNGVHTIHTVDERAGGFFGATRLSFTPAHGVSGNTITRWTERFVFSRTEQGIGEGSLTDRVPGESATTQMINWGLQRLTRTTTVKMTPRDAAIEAAAARAK